MPKIIPDCTRLYIRRGHDFACAVVYSRLTVDPHALLELPGLYDGLARWDPRWSGKLPGFTHVALVWYGSRWLLQSWDWTDSDRRAFGIETRHTLWAAKNPDAAAALMPTHCQLCDTLGIAPEFHFKLEYQRAPTCGLNLLLRAHPGSTVERR